MALVYYAENECGASSINSSAISLAEDEVFDFNICTLGKMTKITQMMKKND